MPQYTVINIMIYVYQRAIIWLACTPVARCGIVYTIVYIIIDVYTDMITCVIVVLYVALCLVACMMWYIV